MRSRCASGSTPSITCCRVAVRSKSRACSASSPFMPQKTAFTCRLPPIRPTSIRYPPTSSRSCRGVPTWSGGSKAWSGGMRRPWSSAPIRLRTALAGISRRSPPRRRCMKSGSITSSKAARIPTAATSSSFKGMRRPAFTRARFSKAGSTVRTSRTSAAK